MDDNFRFPDDDMNNPLPLPPAADRPSKPSLLPCFECPVFHDLEEELAPALPPPLHFCSRTLAPEGRQTGGPRTSRDSDEPLRKAPSLLPCFECPADPEVQSTGADSSRVEAREQTPGPRPEAPQFFALCGRADFDNVREDHFHQENTKTLWQMSYSSAREDQPGVVPFPPFLSRSRSASIGDGVGGGTANGVGSYPAPVPGAIAPSAGAILEREEWARRNVEKDLRRGRYDTDSTERSADTAARFKLYDDGYSLTLPLFSGGDSDHTAGAGRRTLSDGTAPGSDSTASFQGKVTPLGGRLMQRFNRPLGATNEKGFNRPLLESGSEESCGLFGGSSFHLLGGAFHQEFSDSSGSGRGAWGPNNGHNRRCSTKSSHDESRITTSNESSNPKTVPTKSLQLPEHRDRMSLSRGRPKRDYHPLLLLQPAARTLYQPARYVNLSRITADQICVPATIPEEKAVVRRRGGRGRGDKGSRGRRTSQNKNVGESNVGGRGEHDLQIRRSTGAWSSTGTGSGANASRPSATASRTPRSRKTGRSAVGEMFFTSVHVVDERTTSRSRRH